MDGATIQARVYAGYAKAAQVIGLTFSLYRPLSASAPLGNLVGTLKAALDSGPGYQFKAPNEYGDPTWFCVDQRRYHAGRRLPGQCERHLFHRR
ncbi:hypothetical protein ACFS07_10400 [Undibacterium arcticum]